VAEYGILESLNDGKLSCSDSDAIVSYSYLVTKAMTSFLDNKVGGSELRLGIRLSRDCGETLARRVRRVMSVKAQ